MKNIAKNNIPPPYFRGLDYKEVRYSHLVPEEMIYRSYDTLFVGYKIYFMFLWETGSDNAIDWAIKEAKENIQIAINRKAEAYLSFINLEIATAEIKGDVGDSPKVTRGLKVVSIAIETARELFKTSSECAGKPNCKYVEACGMGSCSHCGHIDYYGF